MTSFAHSIGNLVAKLFEGVTPSSWLPAATLVFCTAYFVAVDSTATESPRDGLAVLADAGLGTAIIALLLTTGVAGILQPFQYGLIQSLEGYVGGDEPGRLATYLAKRQADRRRDINTELVESGYKRSRPGDEDAIAHFYDEGLQSPQPQWFCW